MAVDVFSHLMLRAKYGSFDVAEDAQMDIAQFKEKYLALSEYPDLAFEILSPQKLDYLFYYPDKCLFLASKFPSCFNLAKTNNAAATPISSMIAMHSSRGADKTVLPQFFTQLASTLYAYKKESNALMVISMSDQNRLLLEAIRNNHYGLFAVIWTNYQNAASAKRSSTFNFESALQEYLASQETVPWFVKCIIPDIANTKKLNFSSFKYDQNSDLNNLHLALRYDDLESIQLLLNSDQKTILLLQKDENQLTPLEYVAKRGDAGLVNLILQSLEAEENKRDESIRNAIAVAYANAHYAIAIEIATKANFTNTHVSNENSLLTLFARAGLKDEFEKLLTHCDLSHVSHENLLYEAARCGKDAIVAIILNNDFQIDLSKFIVQYHGRKSIIFQNCYTMIYNKWLQQEVKKMEQNRNNLEQSNSGASTPRLEITTYLQNRAVVFGPTNNYFTEAMLLKVNDIENQEDIRYRYDRFVPPQMNQLDNDLGETNLHKMVRAKRLDLIKDLINKGADLYKENKSGLSALELALQIDYPEGFHFLLNCVQDFDQRRTKPPRYVFCDRMLNALANYLKIYPTLDAEEMGILRASPTISIDQITFLWNYFGESFYKYANKMDAHKIAYFFKRLYIEAVKCEVNGLVATLPEDKPSLDTTLALQIITYVKLFNKNTMIGLNTSVNFSLQWGSVRSTEYKKSLWKYNPLKSTQYSKLEELSFAAARLLNVNIQDIDHVVHLKPLTQKLNDSTISTRMQRLIADLNRMSVSRSVEFGAEKIVCHAFTHNYPQTKPKPPAVVEGLEDEKRKKLQQEIKL